MSEGLHISLLEGGLVEFVFEVLSALAIAFASAWTQGI